MSKAPPSARRDSLRAVVPKMVELTENVLFGDVWERPELSKRDRSLITIAACVTAFRPDQLGTHVRRGLENGLTQEEISEAVTHLAFYAGWPSAVAAAHKIREIFEAAATPPAD